MTGRWLSAVGVMAMMVAVAIWPVGARAAAWDWAEGAGGAADGATRDYYNGAARLAWRH